MNERTHTKNTQPLYTRVVRYTVKRIQQIVNLYLVKEANLFPSKHLYHWQLVFHKFNKMVSHQVQYCMCSMLSAASISKTRRFCQRASCVIYSDGISQFSSAVVLILWRTGSRIYRIITKEKRNSMLLLKNKVFPKEGFEFSFCFLFCYSEAEDI